MKKTIALIIAGILTALTVSPVFGLQEPTIPIIDTTRPAEGHGRDADLFVAEYDDVLNCVVLSCVNPCGNISVTLVSTVGDWYQTVFNTLDGTILIPTSGDSGHYTLTLVASDGSTFAGEFDL